MSKNILIVFVLFLLLSLATVNVYAQRGNRQTPIVPVRTDRTPRASAVPVRSGTPNIEDRRVNACQAREAAIRQRSSRLLDLAENMFAKFGAITTRVTEFYQDNGLNLTNYDTLVGAISTSKINVELALDAAQDSLESFSCTSADPRQQLTSYNQNMRKVQTELKAYKKSVRDLIVAVHSIAEDN